MLLVYSEEIGWQTDIGPGEFIDIGSNFYLVNESHYDNVENHVEIIPWNFHLKHLIEDGLLHIHLRFNTFTDELEITIEKFGTIAYDLDCNVTAYAYTDEKESPFPDGVIEFYEFPAVLAKELHLDTSALQFGVYLIAQQRDKFKLDD